MIVQHTSKECKTKFSIGVEFKNSFNKYENPVGCHLREMYESAKILSEQDFKEELEHVLFDS